MRDARQGQYGHPPLELGALSEAWLAILNQMPVGVTVAEVPGGKVLWDNGGAVQMLEDASIVPSGAGEYCRYGAVHEDGAPYAAHEYPLARAVLDGEVVEREPMYYRRDDGRLMILEVSALRVKSVRGRQFGVCTFQDVTEEYMARRALKEAAERVELALNAGAIIGTWVWDLTKGVITADELFAQSFGLDPERCRSGISPEDTIPSVHPDDLAGVTRATEEALARGGPTSYQYRVLHRDGAYRWVEANGRVEMDERGRPTRLPGILLDITARRQVEDARNMLMREVDHRARNALTMVQSVLRLTDASEPDRYREEVTGRVEAMARAQGSLARSNWEGGVLEDLVREEITPYAPTQRFAVAGPTITLQAEQVQPLSMIIHEMTTNAVKHGALSAPAGSVEVSWMRDRAGQIQLAWQETGGPEVRRPEREGFGSRLIRRLAAQLGGAVEIDWQVTGVAARLTWRS